jgi:hypothetical protein
MSCIFAKVRADSGLGGRCGPGADMSGRVIGAAAAACLSIASAQAQEIRLGDLRAHLYLERSGKLSDDLLAIRSPKLADVPRGEGVFGEPANTVVLNVQLLGAPNTQPKHATAMVNITTTNRTGQRRTETRPLMGFVFGEDGKLNRPVVLDNVTCSKVEIEVKSRAAAKRAVLEFTCTEPRTAEVQPEKSTVRR